MSGEEWYSEVSRSLGRIEGKLDAQNGRIKKLEDDATRQWWVSIAIAPALALMHSVARKLGIDV